MFTETQKLALLTASLNAQIEYQVRFEHVPYDVRIVGYPKDSKHDANVKRAKKHYHLL